MLGALDNFFLKNERKSSIKRAAKRRKQHQGLGSVLRSLFVTKKYDKTVGLGNLDGWKDDKEKFKLDLLNDIKTFLFGRWEKPWRPGLIFDSEGKVIAGFRNIHGRVFKESGNVMGLERNKGVSPFFATLAYVEKENGKVLDKDKTTTILSYIPITKDGLPKEKPDFMLPKFHSVINVDYVEGIKKPTFRQVEFKDLELNEYVESFIEILSNLKRIPKLHYDQSDRAYYSHSLISWTGDSIHLAPIRQFKNIEGYYSTLFHEITHSTMNPNRCGRGKNGNSVKLDYANEELVAEMGAMIICSELGLNYNRQNSLTYLKGWLRKAGNDPDSAMIEAYSFACDAAEYLLKDIDLEKLVPKSLQERAKAEEKPQKGEGKEAEEIQKTPRRTSSKKTQSTQKEKVKKPTSSNRVKVTELFIDDIHTDEKRFQNRKNAFSEDSKNRIVKAAKEGKFDWAKFDPILVWMDTNLQKIFVLSGHSRLAAFRELAKEGYKEFEKIPIRNFEGSEKEAIDAALNSNTLSTKETDIERANYYNRARSMCELQQGLGAKTDCEKLVEAECREREGKNATFILNLSYLNPEGFLMDSLAKLGSEKENENVNTLRTVASWVGEGRRQHPDMNDLHENEVARWLITAGYGNKKGQFKSKSEFLERLRVAIKKWQEKGAKPEELLNIANAVTVSTFEAEWQKRLNDAKAKLEEAKKDHEEKYNKYLFALMEGKLTQDRMDELMKPLIAYVAKCKAEVDSIKEQQGQVRNAESAQKSLFGFTSLSKPKKKIKTHRLNDDLGEFLGEFDRNQYTIALRGDKGAGKSRLLYQLVNSFASKLYQCAIISAEMPPESLVVQRYIEQYVKPANLKRIDITGEKQTYDSLNQICKLFDVVALDSWTKMEGLTQFDFDRLQKENPKTIIISIFQSTTGKVARGGNMVEYDCGTVIQVNVGGRAVCEKNRYAPTDCIYNVFEQKIERIEEEGKEDSNGK